MKNKKLSAKSFLNFDDIRSYKEINSHEYILAQAIFFDEEEGRRHEPGYRTSEVFIMSAMIKKKDFKKYIETDNYYNYSFQTLGEPVIWTDSSDKVYFDIGENKESNNIKAYYFIRRFNPAGSDDSDFRITQSFEFFHDLVTFNYTHKKILTDIKRDVEVVKQDFNPANHDMYKVLVHKHYLKNYLAARNMGLATWLSVCRRVHSEEEIEEIDVNDGAIHHHISKDRLGDKHVYYAELVIKDIVQPYSKPIEGYGEVHRDYNNPFKAPMIISLDQKTGEPLESTHETSFLTPVYFRKEILVKYINDKRTRVDFGGIEMGLISFLDQWSITFGKNQLERIMVWLGDVHGLPYEEQLYWRHFNIPPEGGIASQFFNTQIMSEWDLGESQESSLLALRERINGKVRDICGKDLFINTEQDKKYTEQLFLPMGRDLIDMKPRIEAISQLFIDSINPEVFKDVIKDKSIMLDSLGNKLRGLRLIDAWFNESFPGYPQGFITKHLKYSWNLRNLYSHHFSEVEYIKLIKKINERIDYKDLSSIYAYLLKEIIYELNIFTNIIT